YRAAEIALYAGLAKEKGLSVHLDGARLGNVLANGKTAAAEMTWRAG
ncbi:MAG TPA: threonine aldolase, partial [Hyphomonas adhaerens]|nr:threonine aldolase [Hyphomonas adhaerens]